MTIPKIIITIEDGLVQDILSSHQVEVFVLDCDVQGYEEDDKHMVNGRLCLVSERGLILPDEDERLKQTLRHIMRRRR